MHPEVRNMSTPITTPAAHARGREAEFTQVGGWDSSSDSDAGHSAVEESDRGDSAAEGNDEGDSAVEGSDEGDSAVEGSDEHFDESEHVDGFAEEERSTDGEDGSGEEVDESEGEDEKVAEVRRGVISRRRRVMRKVVRMRKRVTRRCGMRCRKPYQPWGMKSTTRPFCAQGLKRRDPLQQHHPKRQCGLRMCLVYLYLLMSMCTTASIR